MSEEKERGEERWSVSGERRRDKMSLVRKKSERGFEWV